MALDPHPREPDHVLWMAVNNKNQKFIVNELVTRGLVRELAYKIKDIEQKSRYRIEQRLIDPSAYIDDQHNEKPSVGSQLFDLDLHFVKGSKDLQAGIKRTNDALDYEMKGGLFIREPEIYIFDTCLVAIKQLDEYVWDNYVGRSADNKQLKGRPRDKSDHQCENLHRLLLAEPSFVRYSNDQVIHNLDALDDLDPYD